ncbi:hypothetical protein BSKO_01736 [Bryopsis sp. KO-2023]|nr:hypothetical protein BSKO_01736 [Bryopsis sp. KO-2023]
MHGSALDHVRTQEAVITSLKDALVQKEIHILELSSQVQALQRKLDFNKAKSERWKRKLRGRSTKRKTAFIKERITKSSCEHQDNPRDAFMGWRGESGLEAKCAGFSVDLDEKKGSKTTAEPSRRVENGPHMFKGMVEMVNEDTAKLIRMVDQMKAIKLAALGDGGVRWTSNHDKREQPFSFGGDSQKNSFIFGRDGVGNFDGCFRISRKAPRHKHLGRRSKNPRKRNATQRSDLFVSTWRGIDAS